MPKSISFAVLLMSLFSCSNHVEQEHAFADCQVIDLEEVLKESKASNKPVLLYFTCWACVNARKMEENILSLKTIDKKLREEFIFIPLYVDDATKLPEEQWIKHPRRKRMIKTVGTKNNYLQIEISQTGSQPQFTALDSNKNVLNKTSYTTKGKKFDEFLDTSLELFNQNSALNHRNEK